MPDFRIFETKGFEEDLKQDFGGRKDKVRLKLLNYVYPQLKEQPYFGKNIKKLVNYKPESWRYRLGDYRLFYQINGPQRIVIMIAADSRGSAY